MLLVTLVLLFGVCLPLGRVPVVLERENDIQAYYVNFASSILKAGEPYYAGVDMIFTHSQSPSELRRMSRAKCVRVKESNQEQAERLVALFREAPPKLLIENYRTSCFPKQVLDFFREHYLHISGNLLIFAPTLKPGDRSLDIPFAGTYRVLGQTAVTINGRLYSPDEQLRLQDGKHNVQTSSVVRLQYFDELAMSHRNVRYAEFQALFENVYRY